MGSDMSMNGKKRWFINGASPGRALEFAREVLQRAAFALLLASCFWSSFRDSVAAYKRIWRAPCWVAWASWRGASALSVMAMRTMAASMAGAALLMTLAFVMRLIAMALAHVNGD